ncbi:hypothetical protein D3C71_1651260 [compost metagenome]
MSWISFCKIRTSDAPGCAVRLYFSHNCSKLGLSISISARIAAMVADSSPLPINSFSTPLMLIFSSLSRVSITDSCSSAGTPMDSRISPRKRRLFHFRMVGMSSLRKASVASCISSASASGPEMPTTSTSHCRNSRRRPRFTGPSRNTFPISYRLKGNSIPGFKAITLAKGIVRS